MIRSPSLWPLLLLLLILVDICGVSDALQQQDRRKSQHERPSRRTTLESCQSRICLKHHGLEAAKLSSTMSRRNVLLSQSMATLALGLGLPANAAPAPNGLPLQTAASSGLRWADATIGTGPPLVLGAAASIDYSMASTAGRFPQIYTTKDKGAPYRWILGDGSTISGLELAILGDESDGLPPMRPGGIRRLVIPSNLGYQVLAKPNAKCIEGGKDGAVGPIPPKDLELAAYQRWVQFYCNPRIPYQPDLVLDIKLYGKRT